MRPEGKFGPKVMLHLWQESGARSTSTGDASISIKVVDQQGVGGRPIEQIQRVARAKGIPVQIRPQTRLSHLAGNAITRASSPSQRRFPT